MRRRALQPYRKKTMRWYFLYHGISCLLITKMLNFLAMKNTVFLSQKVDGNMIFTDYRKVLVLIFSGMRYTAFFEPKSCWKDDIFWLLKSSCFNLAGDEKHGLFWVKKSMERWYLLITEKFLFWSFRDWEIRSFLSQKVDGKMIFTGCW